MRQSEETALKDGPPGGVDEFGYKQSLDRSLGRWATFAAGISYISILTGIFQLFGFGFTTGGPAYWWTWPILAVGQLAVALVFAELAGQYPVAGSVYNWGKRVSGAFASWMSGYIYAIATTLTFASVALAYQVILPQISDVFQIVGDGKGTYDAAGNAVLLGCIGVVLATLINCAGVKLLSTINQIGVFLELIAAVVLIIALAFSARRGPDVVFQTAHTAAGHSWGYLGAFLIAGLAPAYVLFGFDTASSLGEETRDPHKNAPKSVIQAPLASAILGAVLVLVALMAAPNLKAAGLLEGGLPFLIRDVFGSVFGNVMLVAVTGAITVCLLALQAAAVRMIFAMARDNNLPSSGALARVSPRSRTPVVPAVIVGAIALIVLIINVRQTQIVYVVTSVAVVMVYVAYLLITVPMLKARLEGRWAIPPGRFSLGRLGLPINLLAVVWGFLMAVNLAWPRKAVYNAVAPFHWYLQYGGLLFMAVVMGGGAAYYLLVQRHRTAVLAEHQVQSADGAGLAPEPVAMEA